MNDRERLDGIRKNMVSTPMELKYVNTREPYTEHFYSLVEEDMRFLFEQATLAVEFRSRNDKLWEMHDENLAHNNKLIREISDYRRALTDILNNDEVYVTNQEIILKSLRN